MNEQNTMNLKRIMKVSGDRELPANTVHMMDAVEEMAVMDGQAIPITGQVLLMVAAVTTIFYDGNVVPTEMYDITKDDEDTVAKEPFESYTDAGNGEGDEDARKQPVKIDARGEPISPYEPDRPCAVEVGELTLEGFAHYNQMGAGKGNTIVTLEVPEKLVAYFDDSKVVEPEPKEPRETEPLKCEVFYEGKTHNAVIEEYAETEQGMVSVRIEGETTPTLVDENNVKFIDEEVKDE